MQTISHSMLCILLVFCLGCSSLPKAFEQKKSIESVGYFEPKTRQNEYESIVKALGIPITNNPHLVVLKRAKEQNEYNVLHMVTIPNMQKFEDTYNYNGFNVKTNGEFARINSVPILKFCMHLLSKTGEWHISTNIVLFSDNQILTVDKFIQPEEKRKSVEYILLFIPENYDWNKRNDQAN